VFVPHLRRQGTATLIAKDCAGDRIVPWMRGGTGDREVADWPRRKGSWFLKVRRFDCGDLELDGDLVADQDAAGLERGVPGEP
jgi:hypothetical protein